MWRCFPAGRYRGRRRGFPAWRAWAGSTRLASCVEGGLPQAVGQPPSLWRMGVQRLPSLPFCPGWALPWQAAGLSRVAHWDWQPAACIRLLGSAPLFTRPAGMPFSFCLSLPFAPDGLWGGWRALPHGALGLASRWLAHCAEKRAGHGVPSSPLQGCARRACRCLPWVRCGCPFHWTCRMVWRAAVG